MSLRCWPGARYNIRDVSSRKRIYKSSIIQLNDTWMYLLYVTNTFRDTIHTKQHIIQWLGLLLAPERRYLCSDCIDWSGHCISSVLEDFALWQKFRIKWENIFKTYKIKQYLYFVSFQIFQSWIKKQPQWKFRIF